MQKTFFIVGCQRSGTTLLRLILETHSSIRCLDETRAYSVLSGSTAVNPAGKPVTGFKIPRWTEQLDADLLWDYGIPERPRKFYRSEPILFLIRDPYDTVASMLKLNVGGQSWLERWGLPIVQAKAFREASFALRYAPELEALRTARLPLIAAGALCWKYKTAAFLDYVKKGYPVMPVRYEDLVSEPEPYLRRICGLLDVPWEARLLDHARAPHEEVFANGLTVGETNPKRSIDQRSIHQWPEVLGEEECAQIDAIVQTFPATVESRMAGGLGTDAIYHFGLTTDLPVVGN